MRFVTGVPAWWCPFTFTSGAAVAHLSEGLKDVEKAQGLTIHHAFGGRQNNTHTAEAGGREEPVQRKLEH
jgi:hypothetical protein